MRYILYGSGAVGSVIGGRLYQTGHDVILICRGAHLKHVQEKGLTLKTPDETYQLPVTAVGHPSEIHFSGEDIVLFTMKSQDSEEAHRTLFDLTEGDLPVVCAQNGTNNEPLALRRFRRVYGMNVRLPSSYIEPGVVTNEAAPRAGVLDLGLYPQGVDDLARQVAKDLETAGFSSQADPDIMRWKYTKLLFNLDNVLSAIFKTDEPTDDISKAIREEALACYQAAGIVHASPEEMRERSRNIFKRTEIEGSPRMGSSTWQSLARGRSSVETDYLNGEIVLLGAMHGIPTPYNRAVQILANRIANEGKPPGSLCVDDLKQVIQNSGRGS
jgi:2-dehydropantoate 2-reductase